ncbi:right-handed parallel beta-helix repeat-containing protein [Desulfococcaceae bacterium HSG8]|nr:right-handed parallel beta-helix repeat-containing protein [Desulfococcaceae bacterium HSG8]
MMKYNIPKIILVFTFMLTSLFLHDLPALATDVGGIIESYTQWTRDKSPYIVTGNILVKENVRLDIDPGVTVQFKTVPIQSAGYYIRVDGILKAQGTEDNPIRFTAEDTDRHWGYILFTDTSTDWNEATSIGCILSNCIIEYGGNAEDAASVISVDASPLIKNSIIRYSISDGIHAFGGKQEVTGNLIHDNRIGIVLSCQGAVIENNFIADNQYGIYLDSSTKEIDIKNNTIRSSSGVYGACMSINLYYNSDAEADEAAVEAAGAAQAAITAALAAEDAAEKAEEAVKNATDDDAYWVAAAAAVEARSRANAAETASEEAIDAARAALTSAEEAAAALTAKISVRKNDIESSAGNAISITEQEENANFELHITDNNIKNPGESLAVYVQAWISEEPAPIDMTDNWWETTDVGKIGEMIFDFNNDFYLPEVTFQPVSTEPIPGTGSDISYGEDDDTDTEEPDQPGVIRKDTVWTLDESPYMITGNVLIKEDVALKIEPGVVIRFTTPPVQPMGYYIRVDGTLDAQGTEDNPIRFTADDIDHHWGGIIFTDQSKNWDETASEGCILSNCIIEYATGSFQEGGQDGSASVLCLFASPLIKNNTVRYSSGDAVRALGGFQKIISNLIHDNGRGIYLTSDGGLIGNNYITGNIQGIYVASSGKNVEIKNNTIVSDSPQLGGSCIGIDLDLNENISEILIHKNHIKNSLGNAIAIAERAPDANYELTLTENNIENTGNLAVYLYNWQSEKPVPIDMPDNWWGTTDTDEIDQMIYDSKNDFYLPEVRYEPVAEKSIADTGSGISYPPESDDDVSYPPGVISRDTLWTLAESPYLITGNILVKEDVTLEIEPGVVVRFGSAPVESVGYYIRVDGTLRARGNTDQPIIFTAEKPARPWGCIAFTDESMDWDETDSTGCALSNCIIEYAGGNLQDSPQSFGGSSILCFSASPLIKNNVIRYSAGDGISLSGGFQNILSNRIHNTSIGIRILSEGALVENNHMTGNIQAIYAESGGKELEIKNNTIISYSPQTDGSCISIGLYHHSDPSAVRIYKNHIENNGGNAIAIAEQEANANYELSLTENNIENPEGNLSVYLYNWQTEDPPPLTMTGNWWGTTDTEEIDRMIYDSDNDFYLPESIYQPVETGEIPYAGANVPYPPPGRCRSRPAR